MSKQQMHFWLCNIHPLFNVLPPVDKHILTDHINTIDTTVTLIVTLTQTSSQFITRVGPRQAHKPTLATNARAAHDLPDTT
jgi:hypothetical protein